MIKGKRCLIYFSDGSSVPSTCEDLTQSQEDGSPITDEQVRKESDSYNWNITREAPDRFKSTIGYQANHSLLNSVTSLPWPYRQMYSCIRQKGGRTSSKSPRR